MKLRTWTYTGTRENPTQGLNKKTYLLTLVNTEQAFVGVVAKSLQTTIIARLFGTIYVCAMRQWVVLSSVHAALKYLTNALTGFFVSVSIIAKVFSYARNMRAHVVYIPRRSVNTEWYATDPLCSHRTLKVFTQLALCLFRHFSFRVVVGIARVCFLNFSKIT